MSRVLVVEDEMAIAELIALNLRHAGFEVTVVDNGEDAQTQIDKVMPDLVLLDWMLPGQSGLTLAKRWRGATRTRDIPIIMLTARAEEADKVAGLDAGADDYLTKPFAFSELAARLEALVRRAQIPAPTREMQVADLRVNLISRSAERAGQPLLLQPREFRLLAFLMQHAHQIVTRTMLLESVWDYRFDPQTNVIDVHISRLRSKVDKGFATPLIHTVRGVGYSLSDQPQDLPEVV